jgi:Pyruvate/2-oxoacid:ferredoxin oxidoreductase gamma subunit
MKLSQLISALQLADIAAPNDDPEVVVCFEPTALEEGFDWEHTEGISDVRVAPQWPLPGESVIVPEGEKASKVIIFYDNHFALDSAKE